MRIKILALIIEPGLFDTTPGERYWLIENRLSTTN